MYSTELLEGRALQRDKLPFKLLSGEAGAPEELHPVHVLLFGQMPVVFCLGPENRVITRCQWGLREGVDVIHQDLLEPRAAGAWGGRDEPLEGHPFLPEGRQ